MDQREPPPARRVAGRSPAHGPPPVSSDRRHRMSPRATSAPSSAPLTQTPPTPTSIRRNSRRARSAVRFGGATAKTTERTEPVAGRGRRSLAVLPGLVLNPRRRSDGEVPERSNGAVSKTVVLFAGDRGFESLPLRHLRI